jgi:hypothetical protein
MSIDKRFALISNTGEVRYPYKKYQKETGRYGFAMSTAANPDKNGGGVYTLEIEQVIRHLVFEGGLVRAVIDGSSIGNSIGLWKRGFNAYWVAPEFLHLVRTAKIQPLAHLPKSASDRPSLAVASGETSGHPTASAMPLSPENVGEAPLAATDTSPEPIVPEAPATIDMTHGLTVADYILACESIAPDMTSNQRAMLLGHASAPAHTLSMAAIAELGGYGNFAAATVQYEKLSKLFSSHFGIDGLANQTEIIISAGPRGADGQLQWTVVQTLVAALEQLGLIEGDVNGPGLMEAEMEVNADPSTKNEPETTKLALIFARVGQGGYRRRMLRIWGGKCAVTGCSIETVLVASHTKPWATSTNVERLDEYNGLLLAASIDRLFDTGLVSFSDDGKLLCNKDVSDADLIKIGITPASVLSSIHPRHVPYLAAHRKQYGFAE